MEIANYAFIKNEIVINVATFDYPIDESLKNHFINEFELDDIVLSNNNTAINGTYDGLKFWLPKPFESWIKNEETNEWIAPVPYPEGPLHKYFWNEETLSWVVNEIPNSPYPSWTFNEDLFIWQPPVQYPEDNEKYVWDEPSISWLLLPPSN